jgi:Tol biopolymer transport system component
VVNIDGTNLREISIGGSPEKCSWSPDGKRLAVIESRAERSSEPKSDLVVISLDGTQKQIVVENQTLYGQLDLNWSPDGEFLSFVSKFDGKSVSMFGLLARLLESAYDSSLESKHHFRGHLILNISLMENTSSALLT